MVVHKAGRRSLSRRQFLSLSATGAALPWIGGLAQAQPLSAAAPGAARPEALPVGYLDGSDQLSFHFDRLPWSIPERLMTADPGTLLVVPAAGMPLGDQQLAGRDVKLTVHGLYPAPPVDPSGVELLDLDVLFPPPDPARPTTPARYMAWSFRRHPGLDPSPPVSFRVPLGLNGELNVTLRSVYQGDGRGLAQQLLSGLPYTVKSFQTTFTADWQTGRPKIQRGIYLLGVRPRLWSQDTSLPGSDQRSRTADLCSVVVSVEPIAAE
jgi:hypothetical protein